MSIELHLRLPAFARVDAAALSELAAALSRRDHRAGELLVREGDRGDSIYLILAGTVQVVRTEYSEVELNRLGAGDMFGLLALLDEQPRSATCRAVTACTLGCWTGARIHELATAHPQLALAFELALAEQLVRDFRQLDAKVRGHLGARWAIAPDR